MRRLESLIAGLALAAGLSACQTPAQKPAESGVAPVESASFAPVSSVAFTTLHESGSVLTSDFLRERNYSHESFGVVAKDAESLGELYSTMEFGYIADDNGRSQKVLPRYQPDFKREMVIGVFQGYRPATTYGITINSIVETQYELIVVSTLKEHMNNLPCIDHCTVMSPGQLIVCPRSEKPVSFIWNAVDPRWDDFMDPANTYMISPGERGIKDLLDSEPDVVKAMDSFKERIGKDCVELEINLEFYDAFLGVARLEQDQIARLQSKGYSIEKAFPALR